MAKLSSYLRGNTTITGISTSSNLVIGSDTSTGTADQNLQVSGGSYISGNTGIGSAIPQAKLDVSGDTLVTGNTKITGITTLGNTVVGGGTTELVVNGDARVTGILTVGQSSVTIDGTNNKITTPKLDYAGISSSISDTAVDVFVYDTRKDSDGGAWRKRTQHTSWYNETLNTSIRGSRREFPAVAVIVAEATQVTIYDGDDPDLPMWMVTNSGGSAHSTDNILGDTNTQFKSISMVNGLLCVANYTYAFRTLDFIKEESLRIHSSSLRKYAGNVSERDAGKGTIDISSIDTRRIVNAQPNDVAMTVLPNAPIDDATGLQVPTIAVATDGGVSVIKDDGTVINGGDTQAISDIHISKENRLYFTFTSFSQMREVYGPSSWTSSGFFGSHQFTNSPNYPLFPSNSGNAIRVSTDSYGTNSALVLHDPDPVDTPSDADATNGLVAYATTSYNTGWMHGDIKGAFLFDTDATNVTGSELVTNGTFDSDTSGWSATDATLSVSGGELVVTRTAHSQFPYQSFTTVVGKTYTFTAQVKDGTDTSVSTYIAAGTSAGDQSLGTTSGSATITSASFQSISLTFTASSTTTYIMIHSLIGADGETVIWDNVSVRIADPDRSVNNKGLQVFGTVTKSAVATGAELVAYSGWSSSNHLKQPYNSDLDFGTNDFCIIGWINATGNDSHQGIIHRNTDGVASGAGFLMEYRYDNDYLLLQTDNGSSVNNMFSATNSIPANVWTHFCAFVTNSGTRMGIYINGEISNSSNYGSARNVTNTSAVTYVGREVSHADADRPFYGSIALLRVSGSVPSAEQVKKIYEDEKVLFRENTACTLYGSSDAVTALAYDDSTNLLYAGTSSGRSDFQGLRRINNTTTAVTTAMSASNGLVAEQ